MTALISLYPCVIPSCLTCSAKKADDVYDGRLPVHVRCLIDECANIGQIPKLEKLVATIRSREISACLVLQAQSQLKAIYKDNADTIIGNMDTSIFSWAVKSRPPSKSWLPCWERKPSTPTTPERAVGGKHPIHSTIKNWGKS